MKKTWKSRYDGIGRLAVACAFALLCSIGTPAEVHAQSSADVSPDLKSIALAVQHVRDYQEIQNLMARRMWYHSVGQNENELALWSHTQPQNVRWEQDQGCWVGMKSLNYYYNTTNIEMQKAGLTRLSKLNPAIKDEWPANRFIGNATIHTLTSPLIVVAEDGQSAKATWYTIGAILTTNDGKNPAGLWLWEHYGADLVREDGQWRFLHIQVNTDFMNPMGKPLQLQADDAAPLGTETSPVTMDPGPGAKGIKIPGPDVGYRDYRSFSATRVPSLTPRLPVPYRTLSQTFQYADCSINK